MKRKASVVILSSMLSLSLFSCNNQSFSGTIVFDLNEGTFPSSFNKTSLVGKPGDRIDASIIPDPTREGYEFVGWRTLVGDHYENISFQIGEDGKEYTWYPYGTATWYAYFEPQVQIHFDLTDGTSERNASLVAPVRGAESFDSANGLLNGYTSKVIPSTEYLPTATADHMTFQYWYTEYPLVREENEELGTTHYILDTSAEKGEYPFEESFATPSIIGSEMVFPEIRDGEEFTLYAKWEEDPVLRIHYGLDGIEDSTVFVGREQDLAQVIEETFKAGIETETTEDGHKTIENGAKRFDGFFTDPEFTEPFPIDTTTGILNDGLDLYVKWVDRLHLSFDYGDGDIEGEKNFETDDYYVGDILGENFLSSHSPVKENSTFTGYRLGDEAFDVASTPLPQPGDGGLSLSFVANYDDYPELTIIIDYPMNSSVADRTLPTRYFREGESIQSVIDEAIQEIDGEFAYAGLLSRPTADAESQPEEFGLSFMPSEDTTLYVLAGYPTEVTIHSVFGSYGDTAYAEGEIQGFEAFRKFSGSFVLSDIRYADETYSYQDGLYFYDGLYLDEAMSVPFVNASGTVSTDKAEEVHLYQKFTKAIRLTLVDEKGEPLGKVMVLPHGLVEDFRSRIEKALGDYLSTAEGYSLFVTDNGKDYALETVLPSVDSEVKVILHS